MRRIVIATPHYYHTTIAIAAIGAGLNVLTEKPLSVHKADCEKVIEAFENRPDKSKIFSEMFNQRTDNTCTPSPLRPAVMPSRYAQPLRAVLSAEPRYPQTSRCARWSRAASWASCGA